ncbi:MAG: hypothetical protein HGA44_10935 [Cellulomonadaceae bacterium]|nr:hypothetical protein [Cellulomonadaceae bacterium]
MAPSEAARTALATPTGQAGVPTGGPSVAEIMDAYSDAVPMAADPAALVVAARHFDNAAVRWMLARVHPRDVLLWWADLVEPALTRMQEGAALERPGESAVRVLEAAAFAELRSRAAAAAARSEGQAGTGAVLAIPSGPFPDLLVHVLATGLQDRAVQTRVLAGGGAAGVEAALAELKPAAVLLHVGGSVDDGARAVDVVQRVAVLAPSLPLFVHREGSAPLDAPPSVALHRVRTLTGALHEILAVVR